MKKFKKCFSALFLSCFLAFGNVSGCYLEVQAFDYVAPETFLPFDGALPYLMGLLGVFPKDKNSINWEQWKEDYVSDLESQGFDVSEKSEFGKWVENISKGVLDQTSVYWEKFKNWVSGLGASSGGQISSISSSVIGHNVVSEYDNYSFTKAFYYKDYGDYHIYFISSDVSSINLTNNNVNFIPSHYLDGFWNSYNNRYNEQLLSNSTQFSMGLSSNHKYYFYGFGDVHSISSNFYNWNLDISNDSDFTFTLSPESINGLSLAISSAISDAIPDVIPLPWDNVGANENELEDEYDAVLEGIQAGTLDIADAMEKIQELLGLLTVSDTGKIYPENPDKPDETLQDKVNENKDNMGFTLAGLEKVFPFCIPFDLYAFMTLLVAEPVAPVIEWPVYNPVTKNNEIITIDFNTWENIVVLFRYIFDFLFIIGLLLMARALIGGGDSA